MSNWRQRSNWTTHSKVIKGNTGATGGRGATGAKGDKGDKGNTGATGAKVIKVIVEQLEAEEQPDTTHQRVIVEQLQQRSNWSKR